MDYRDADIEVNRHADSRGRDHIGMPMEGLDSVGLRLRYARKELRKMTQPQLASAAGIKQPSLSEIETGETKEISGPVLVAVCKALKVRPEWLITGAGPIEEQAGTRLEIEEAEAITRLRKAHPDWRRYVLGLAMVDSEQAQQLLVTTMRQAVPDYKVEAAYGDAPHVVRERTSPLFTTRGNKTAKTDTKRKSKVEK